MSNLLYEALMLGRNKQVAREEYLVAAGKKEPASFRIQETDLDISNVISDDAFCVHLLQDAPGYLEIEVSCEDPFISFEKRIITTDEFRDGQYEFRFTVLSERLHNGRNFTALVFQTSLQTIEIPVQVDNTIRVRFRNENPRIRTSRLLELYLQHRMGAIEQWQWVQSSMELLSDIPAGDEEGLYLMLYKAQVYITKSDDLHARNYIEHVGTQIPKLERRNYELYSYFIYLASLYQELPGVVNFVLPCDDGGTETDNDRSADTGTEGDGTGLHRGTSRYRNLQERNIADMTALQKVHWVYDHYPSWRILWLLFFMDPAFRSSPALRLQKIKELFGRGEVTTPVLYQEALQILGSRPSLLQEIGEFELQVLYFGTKRNSLKASLAGLLSEQILKAPDDSFRVSGQEILVRILKYAYKKYGDPVMLRALCRAVAQAGIKENAYHVFFEKAVAAGITPDYVCAYYVHTADRTDMSELPEAVMQYSLEHLEVLYEYRDYLYANVISNRYKYPETYKNILSGILAFAENQIIQGQNNSSLAVIYKHILENDLLTANMKNSLFDVISVKELLCDNKRMKSVLVFHKELQVYQESFLKDGKTNIRVYTPQALILFKDNTGNLYYHVSYQINQLLESREYIDQCIKGAAIQKYMLIGDNLPLLRAYKPALEILQFFTSRKSKGKFRRGYEQALLQNIVSYYARISRDEEVYDELLKFRELDLPEETRGQLIGIMLKRGLIDDAYEEIGKYGFCKLEPEQLAQLAHEYIRAHGIEEQELLTAICEQGYGANGFDKLIFEYMYCYYNGRMDILVELYRSSNAYKKPSEGLEERILHKAVESGEHPAVVSLIFRRYYEAARRTGEASEQEAQTEYDEELIRRYIEYRSGLYLYESMTGTAPGEKSDEEGTKDLSFFDFMEKDLMQGRTFTDGSIIAYILVRMKTETPDDRQIRLIEHYMKDLVSRGKMLEEFKYYKKYFELPTTLANNIIISAFSEDPDRRPFIEYEITGPARTVSGAEEMEEIFRYCYVKYFTLFYGEKVVFTMDEQHSTQVCYEDLDIRHDGSRYAALDELIMRMSRGDMQEFRKCAEDFYLKEKLIEVLFSL